MQPTRTSVLQGREHVSTSLPTPGHGRIALVEQDQRVAVVKPQHAIVPYASRKDVADQLIG